MDELGHIRRRIETELKVRVQLNSPHSSTLVEAMRYSVCGSAKRVRALLVCATAMDFGTEYSHARAPAAAIEFIHAYSLVHDDLPDMDDADTRRGKPSCHKEYTNSMAILAGDALQTLAFSTIMEATELSLAQRVACATVLASASGWRYMVGGQAMDMELMNQDMVDLDQLFTMHEGKTGALFRAAVEMGTIVSGFQPDTSQFLAMSNFGTKIGIAFQLTDDLLDTTAAQEELGKPVGADLLAGKKNAVAFLGVNETRNLAAQYLNEAYEILESVEGDMTRVRQLADECVHRHH